MDIPPKNMTKEEAEIWFAAQREKLKRERKAKIREHWENLQPFEKVQDIPELPHAEDPEEWKNFYVKKLIQCGAIPKEDLEDGCYYLGEHRRATVAQWNAKENKFTYNRYKFGNVFLDECNHFEDDDGFALFVPIRKATKEQFERNAE